MRNQIRFHANLLYFKATLMRVVNKNSVISKRKLKGLFQEMYYKATTQRKYHKIPRIFVFYDNNVLIQNHLYNDLNYVKNNMEDI